jgi:hypothetical protein
MSFKDKKSYPDFSPISLNNKILKEINCSQSDYSNKLEIERDSFNQQ